MHYERIISELQIKPSFLNEHSQRIRNQILSTGETLPGNSQSDQGTEGVRPQADIFAINKCVGLARTVLTLGSNPKSLNSVVSAVEEEAIFANQDPATVINTSVLYYLIARLEHNPTATHKEKEALKQVHRRFDELNWMVDRDAVKELGIKAAESQPGKGGGVPFMRFLET